MPNVNWVDTIDIALETYDELRKSQVGVSNSYVGDTQLQLRS